MENRNLYKMDDFLIICSFLMIIPLLVLAWPWLKTVTEFESLSDFFLTAPQLLAPRLPAILLYTTGAISSQIIGRIIRLKEKQSLEILDTLQFYKKTTIIQLSSQLGMTESKITSLVKKMSGISSLGITLEGDSVSIGQKPDIPEAADFSSYINTVSGSPDQTAENIKSEEEPESFDLSFKEALQKAASQKDLSDEQRREELKKVARNYMGGKQNADGKGKKFNIVLFIILFITPLWPIALIYAISYAVKQQKAALENTK